MKTRLWGDRSSKSSIAISIAIHVLVFAGLATITFHYPLQEFFRAGEKPVAVPVRYVALTPKPTAAPSSASAPAPAPRRTPPAQLPQLSNTPSGPPAPVAAVAPPAPIGQAIGAPVAGSTAPSGDRGIGFGLRPGVPDGRLATNPLAVPSAPETEGQKAERALAAIYDAYLDSARAAMGRKGRDPGDWSWGGKDGDKWGWDKNGIHIGGVSIPNAVLAALPLQMGPTGRNVNALTEAHTDAYIRSDIAWHRGLMTQDEFKAAVSRIRERVDRERRERMAKEKEKKQPPCCTQ